jgi:hypothetical protein
MYLILKIVFFTICALAVLGGLYAYMMAYVNPKKVPTWLQPKWMKEKLLKQKVEFENKLSKLTENNPAFYYMDDYFIMDIKNTIKKKEDHYVFKATVFDNFIINNNVINDLYIKKKILNDNNYFVIQIEVDNDKSPEIKGLKFKYFLISKKRYNQVLDLLENEMTVKSKRTANIKEPYSLAIDKEVFKELTT